MSSYVYVLATELDNNRKTYVGWTTDLDRRVKQHYFDGCRSFRLAKPRLPPVMRAIFWVWSVMSVILLELGVD